MINPEGWSVMYDSSGSQSGVPRAEYMLEIQVFQASFQIYSIRNSRFGAQLMLNNLQAILMHAHVWEPLYYYKKSKSAKSGHIFSPQAISTIIVLTSSLSTPLHASPHPSPATHTHAVQWTPV